jgi:hypothetical protein
MMIGACAGSVLFIIALLFGPETKGIVRWVTSMPSSTSRAATSLRRGV